MPKSKKDLHSEVTDRIVCALEAGTPPWSKPWDTGDSDVSGALAERPHNGSSGKRYQGINTLLLWDSALKAGYPSGTWVTYRQALSLGGGVRKGEKGTRIIFFKPFRVESDPDPDQGDDGDVEGKVRKTWMKRVYTVFNVAQCFNVEPVAAQGSVRPVRTWMEALDLEEFVVGTRADIQHCGDEAFYSPSEDVITLPAKTAFRDAGAYYSTLLHELVHWTGHKDRLGREGITGAAEGNGERYVFEELIAEIGAAFLGADFGVRGDLRHESYIGDWIGCLKSDRNAIFRAAAQAEKAAGYLMRIAA